MLTFDPIGKGSIPSTHGCLLETLQYFDVASGDEEARYVAHPGLDVREGETGVHQEGQGSKPVVLVQTQPLVAGHLQTTGLQLGGRTRREGEGRGGRAEDIGMRLQTSLVPRPDSFIGKGGLGTR